MTQAVDVYTASPPTLFGTDDSRAIIGKATVTANALAEVIKSRKLFVSIQGRNHVLVEGWTLLGSLLGVFPVCVWVRPQLDPDGKNLGFEARVEARTLEGGLVGAAEASCSRDEERWYTAREHALRSMAQTRATAKALRLPLGFIMSLAGFEATPAEEMPNSPAVWEQTSYSSAPDDEPPPFEEEQRPPMSGALPTSGGDPASQAQRRALLTIGRDLGWTEQKTMQEVTSFTTLMWDELTKARASAAIDMLKLKQAQAT